MKAKRLICLATAAVFTASMAAVFAGCGDTEDSNKVTVTWYDGTKVLRTDEVEKGSKLTSWTPEKEDMIFTRWYSDSSKTLEYSFDSTVDEELDLFAGWRSAVAAEDNRIWYAIGTGAETLKASNWTFATKPNCTQVPVLDEDGNPTGETKDGDPIFDDNGAATFTVKKGFENLIFSEKDEKNTFEITLTLRPGDTFRFLTGAINSDWTGGSDMGQAGIGQLEGFEYADGSAGGEEVTAADRKYGIVKDSEGTQVFYGWYENNHLDTTYWNLHVGADMDGEYTFTMTTLPGDDGETTIKWSRKPVKAQTVTHMMYLIGTYGGNGKTNNFWNPTPDDVVTVTENKDGDKEYTKKDVPGLIWLEKEADGVTYKGYVTITEDDYVSGWGADENGKAHIKVKNAVSGKDYGINGGSGNAALSEAGTYCVVYKSDTDLFQVEKCEYYVAGTHVVDGANVNFTTHANYKMTTGDNGATYTLNLTVTDMRQVDGYTWLVTNNDGAGEKDANGNPAVYAIQVVYGTVIGGVKDWGNGNTYLSATGDVTVTYTVEGKTTTVS